jgi:hypothetical protein
MGRGIICQACGIEAPVKHVHFYQNIGALVMRFSKEVEGNLCKRCIHSNFWSMTLINLSVGWLGVISLVLAPVFSIINICQYLGALGLEPVPPGAKAPMLTQEVFGRIGPHANQLISRLEAGQDLNDLAREVAQQAGVTPGEVVLFVIHLAEQQRGQAAQMVTAPAMGFPVQSIGYPVDVPEQQKV